MSKKTALRISLAIVLWIITVAWGVFIFSMSAEPAEKSENTSGRVVEFVAETVVPDYEELSEEEKTEIKESFSVPIRKLAHFSEFAVLGALVMISVKVTLDKKLLLRFYMLISAAAGLVYAITDELHQSFIPGRAPAVKDVLIDFSGICAGVLAVTVLIYIIEKRFMRKAYNKD